MPDLMSEFDEKEVPMVTPTVEKPLEESTVLLEESTVLGFIIFANFLLFFFFGIVVLVVIKAWKG